MPELKRTQLFDTHVRAGGTMVDFGGWEMPVQYPEGIIAEHLYTRASCSLFDVSHMGRIEVRGARKMEFLQYALTSNAAALPVGRAQYCVLSDENGFAVDDAYLFRWADDDYLLIINAGNIDKDLAHLAPIAARYDVALNNVSAQWASIAVQGPRSTELLAKVAGTSALTEDKKNALGTVMVGARPLRLARTGYTGEPIGYETFVRSEDAAWLWDELTALGAKPAGLGARDTLRLEAGYPLYGHELGADPSGSPIPIFATPAARFAVSFADEKGDFLGRAALSRQAAAAQRIKDGNTADIADLPRRVVCIALADRGVMRAGMELFHNGTPAGWVTSGTVVPYYTAPGGGDTARRAIGMAYADSTLRAGDTLEVDVRGRRLKAVIVGRHLDASKQPYALPVLAGV